METVKKLQNLSVHVNTLFSDQSVEINPADVNWVLIQDDSGISVREMNVNWGSTLCYYWMNDDLELRSSGTDGIFFAKMISSELTLFDLRFGRG